MEYLGEVSKDFLWALVDHSNNKKCHLTNTTACILGLLLLELSKPQNIDHFA